MGKPVYISPHRDIQGKALMDHYLGKAGTALWLHNNYGLPEEMPIAVFFREYEDFPDLEQFALSQVRGEVLDIGAGAGAHSLYLQEKGFRITAIEQSEKTARLLLKRGVKSVVQGDIFQYHEQRYDTLLLLMNGIGLIGKLARIPMALAHFKSLLKPGGQLIFDSSDIAYLYEHQDRPEGKYYGELSYRYEYQGQKGDWFDWLYVDKDSLFQKIDLKPWLPQVIYEEGSGHYLIKMTLTEA